MKTKKIASLLLAGLLALSVAACGQQNLLPTTTRVPPQR